MSKKELHSSGTRGFANGADKRTISVEVHRGNR